MTSAENLNYTEEEIEKFQAEHARGIVEIHGWKIKPGEIQFILMLYFDNATQ